MTPVISAVRAALASRLAGYERRGLAAAPRVSNNPIFVVSLPRSGSTLLYQLLLQRFRLAYFSNLMAVFPDSPVAVASVARWFGGLRPPLDLRSTFGATRGWRGPNQGWRIWNRWFPEDQDYIDPASLDPAAVAEMRATIAGLQLRAGAPFVNKWQRHGPRLRALASAFPEALFIYLRRAPELTAQSILAGRRRFLRDETAWLSARPRDYERLRRLEPLEQVCGQVVALERDLREDQRLVGSERFMFVSYEALCLAPQSVLDGIADWYRERSGVSLAVRQDLALNLDAQSRLLVEREEFEQIRSTLERLYAQEQCSPSGA